ncbi:MAG: bifunctional UDP-sugar hydrolase/5'-nucleotidase, partial [Elusimicrobiales bacterium]|nr:bifunctional UDP-sugar hydrolase/5'-nucleotidase [Elusimicrobiales bacterium]
TIVIYHTSDVHGEYFSRPAKWDKENSTRAVGGFAALSAQAKKEKSPVIFLDSGDWYTGTPEGSFSKGMTSVLMMNLLGYKASAVGNHEYDSGADNLRTLVSSAAFAVLGANIKNKADNSQVSYAKPYTVIDADGIKLGVIGLSNEDTSRTAMPAYVRDFVFTDEAQALSALLPEVKSLGVNAVIVLAHDGLSRDEAGRSFDAADWTPSPRDYDKGTLALARAAKGGVAAILGGHLHTAITNGYLDRETGTLIAESGYGLAAASRIELKFDDKTGKLTGASARLVDLWTDRTGEDPAVLAALEPARAQVSSAMNETIARAQTDILRHADGNNSDVDSPLGDLVCDILRSHAKTQVAFQNTHGARADLRKGAVTLRDMYEVMPFENTLVVEELTGAQLEEVMRENIRGNSSGMQESGLEIEYDTAPNGGIGQITVKIGGKPVDPAGWYTVATNNYLALGGSGGKTLSQGRNIRDTLATVRDVLISAARTAGTLSAPRTGRIKKR